MATAPTTRLRGTPAVAGVAYGPVVVARTEVDPAAIARFRDAGPADTDAALAAYDAAAGAVAAGFADQASVASGSAAAVLTASAGLARDKGLRRGSSRASVRGPGCSTPCTGRSRSS